MNTLPNSFLCRWPIFYLSSIFLILLCYCPIFYLISLFLITFSAVDQFPNWDHSSYFLYLSSTNFLSVDTLTNFFLCRWPIFWEVRTLFLIPFSVLGQFIYDRVVQGYMWQGWFQEEFKRSRAASCRCTEASKTLYSFLIIQNGFKNYQHSSRKCFRHYLKPSIFLKFKGTGEKRQYCLILGVFIGIMGLLMP